VFVSDETFVASVHGQMGCITCHGGVSGAQNMEAHEGVVRDPDSVETCGPCHGKTVTADQNSLHSELTGYMTALAARSTPDKIPQLEEMVDNHCAKCHTSCGQCHVSMPTNLGGGLSAGHEFKQVPPMNLTCMSWQPHQRRVQGQERGRQG